MILIYAIDTIMKQRKSRSNVKKKDKKKPLTSPITTKELKFEPLS